jgi:multidrug efflux pump subunit AcrA (membrane-fusion protein)
MNKKFFYFLTIVMLFFAFLGFFANRVMTRATKRTDTPVTSTEESFYYTCPMHPEIHQDHPGNCPICHMKLVKVSGQPQGSKGITVDPEQLSTIGVTKYTVATRNLEIQIPFSGRMNTSQTLSFQIYESDLALLKPGYEFQATNSSRPGQKISGVISNIDSVIDPASRTVRAVAAARSGYQGLLPETTVSGVILVKLKDRVAVPENAVVHTGRGDLVYLVEDKMLTPRAVKLGHKDLEYYEVLEGLAAGDVIASGPNFLIDSETKIRGFQ